jgi:cobalt-zinc-cadmium efflux system outer membrane protein
MFFRTLGCGALIVSTLLSPMRLASQQLTEKGALRRFAEENQRSRALAARVEVARAETGLRTLLPTPSVSYSREDAVTKEDYFVVEQRLPVNGRLSLLRRAGDAAINSQREQSNYDVHQLRTDLREAFYELLMAQQREELIRKGLSNLHELVRVLTEREREGEGSAFDRLRAERELANTQADLISTEALTARGRTQVASFFAPGTEADSLLAVGQFDISRALPDLAVLIARALEVRGDHRAQEEQLQQFSWERRAAERLRIPEPVLSGGMKRVQTTGISETGHIISVTVPFPLLNRSRTEAALAQAAYQRTQAERQALRQQIASEVKDAYVTTELRRRMAGEYKQKVGEKDFELTRIAQVAYQEGEHRILELLDAYGVTLSSQLRVLDLVAAAKLAEIELERATGEEVFP